MSKHAFALTTKKTLPLYVTLLCAAAYDGAFNHFSDVDIAAMHQRLFDALVWSSGIPALVADFDLALGTIRRLEAVRDARSESAWRAERAAADLAY